MTDFNANVVEEFRANRGVVGGPFAGRTMLLLDGPAHTRVRDSVRDVFTPSYIAQLRPAVEAIAAGGSSLRDHRQATGELGYFQHAFRVYDREGAPCPSPGCPGHIRRIVQSGRSSYFCALCQK